MVERRGRFRGFWAHVWELAKRDFGFEERQPDLDGPPRVRDLALLAIIAALIIVPDLYPGLVQYAIDLYPGLGRVLLDTLLIVYFLAAAHKLPLRHAAAQPQRYLAAFGLPFVLLLLRSKVGRDNADLISCLIILLLLGGFILKLAKRPRGAEVDWNPLIILALVLFGPIVAPPRGAAPADEKVKAAYKACLNAAKECSVVDQDTYKKCNDAFEACAANAWR